MTVWPHYPTRVWFATFKAAWTQVDERNLSLVSAGVAFFSLLSLFPTLTALVSLWGMVADPAVLQSQLPMLREMVPESAYSLIEDQVTKLVTAPSSALTWAGILALLLALWWAKAGVDALVRGLNAVYSENNRGGVRHIAAVLALTVVLIFMAMVFLALLIGVPVIMSFVPLGPLAEIGVRAVKWLMLAGMLVVALGLIYRMAPNRRGARIPWLSPGAVIAAVTWLLGSAGFTIYFENFGSYNEVYGSLGAIIALLLWFFVSALVVLFGAAINAELERHTERDSTIGPERPRGQRGAHVADTYVQPAK